MDKKALKYSSTEILIFPGKDFIARPKNRVNSSRSEIFQLLSQWITVLCSIPTEPSDSETVF